MSAVLQQPVIFVGFMGAGKTSVSQYLAHKLSLPLVDVDEAIVQEQKRSIADIFATEGEDAFRALESTKLAELLNDAPQLISCGGGIVENEENRRRLQHGCFVVFLEVDAQEASLRVGGDTTRPLFTDMDAVTALLEKRSNLYKQVASIAINTTGRDIPEIAAEVQDVLCKQKVLAL